MNTDEELIQKAIELCKNNVTRLEKTIAEQQVEGFPWRCEVTFYGTELNSWKTHLAEILGLQEWLKDCEEGGSWSSPEEIESAIKFLLDKAKRLLGGE